MLAEGRDLRLADEGIFSALSPDAPKHQYDGRAAVYDRVVGTRLYNRVMWGASTLDYAAFARRAATSHPTGRILDAACGSLLFTAEVYLAQKRTFIALDQSLAMLKRARRRLIKLAGSIPTHVILLQADLSDPPFRPASFQTVLCMNVLHHVKDARQLVARLKSLLTDDGELYLTSLVSNNRFVGDRYLEMLYRTGELVRPRSSAELKSIMEASFGQETSYRTEGNMAYATSRSARGDRSESES